jgi:hypothetical protein
VDPSEGDGCLLGERGPADLRASRAAWTCPSNEQRVKRGTHDANPTDVVHPSVFALALAGDADSASVQVGPIEIDDFTTGQTIPEPTTPTPLEERGS